jgi:outer membrane translocation and assembly module TamA
LRYRLSTRSRAFTFFDVGGFHEDASSPTDRSRSDVFAGAGVGVALETRASGIVRFEIAAGRGDGFSDAKVHVGLEQEF